jgi:hypothetical protein
MPDKERPIDDSLLHELQEAGVKPAHGADQASKKNWSERFSRELARKFADALREQFHEILPDGKGRRQESHARTSRGYKKLDVNYSIPELGLALGISIKTINFRDPRSKTYKKNLTRVDNELRAEAKDYHHRQPFAVLVAVLFLPADAAVDTSEGRTSPSSFGSAVQHFRYRANRQDPKNEDELFERMFVALYEESGPSRGDCAFFDVMEAPPRVGRPAAEKLLTFGQVIAAIIETYDLRNDPPFRWAGE